MPEPPKNADGPGREPGTVALIVTSHHHEAGYPQDNAPVRRFGEPCSFGLGRRELFREICRCQRRGWFPWELKARFVNPRDVDERGIGR